MDGEILTEPVIYHPIGVAHSPFRGLEGMPIQPRGASGVCGTIVVYPQYTGGLKDLTGFSRIIVLSHYHRSSGFSLEVIPFLDSVPRGVFATRAPKRPNPIGISSLRLLGIEKNVIHVEEIDLLDGTPVLDIKPYIPGFDAYPEERAGWLERSGQDAILFRSDGRFA